MVALHSRAAEARHEGRMRGGTSESQGGWGLTEALSPRANVPGD